MLRGRYRVSERRACRVLKQPLATQRYASKPGDVDDDFDFDVDDIDTLIAAYNASSYDVRYDEDLDGTFDTADITAFASASGSGSHGCGEVSAYQVTTSFAGLSHELALLATEGEP